MSKRIFHLSTKDYGGARKRLFIGLMVGTCLTLCLFLASGWIIPAIGLAAIHPALPFVSGVICAVLIAALGWLCIGLVLHIYSGLPLPGVRRIRGLVIRLMLPLMEMLGRFVGVSKSEVLLSFIKVNNELVLSDNEYFAPNDVLILLPHCLQDSACPHRLTYDINNCRHCGSCSIHGLLELRDRYHVKLALATGGSIARRIVVKEKPRLILAVACERDLASGIQDTWPIPVFGVLNERPCGPCINTRVALTHVEDALRIFITPEALAEMEKKKEAGE